MKNVCFLVIIALLLAGCGGKETFETVCDEWVQPAMAQPREISLRLPEDALAPALENDAGQVYLGDGYELFVDTLSAGDLNATVRSISGYAAENVTLMETRQQGLDRYEFVWVSAGEQGERLGRAVILDDGTYHYCLSALWDAGEKTAQSVWNDVFASFALL